MSTKDIRDIQSKLAAPFAYEDIGWRLTWNKDTTGIAVPYVTNRAIQQRLDDAVGIDCWSNSFSQWKDGRISAQLCTISIYFKNKNQWIGKTDGADDTWYEGTKGGLSDSMKRAAVQWGIGRYLYNCPTTYVDIEMNDGKAYMKKDEKTKLTLYETYQDLLNAARISNAVLTENPSRQEYQANRQEATGSSVSGSPTSDGIGSIFSSDAAAFSSWTAPEETVQNVYEIESVAKASGFIQLNLKKDGRVIPVCASDACTDLKKGRMLINPSLVEKHDGEIRYYVLGSYQVA